MHAMGAEESNDQRHGHSKGQTGIVESHGHGQNARAQGTLEQVRQSAAGTGSIGIAVLEGMVGIIREGKLFFRQVGSGKKKVRKY